MRKIMCAAIGIWLVFSACSTRQTNTCVNEQAVVKLADFDSTETDTVELRFYERSTGFATLRRTETFIAGSYDSYYDGGTTTLRSVFGDTDNLEIRIPAAGRSYRISDIVYDPPHQETIRVPFGAKVDILPCLNHLLSFKLDGVFTTWSQDRLALILSK